MEIKQVAINYIKKLSTEEKSKMKVMLQHNIICGSGIAKENNIKPELLSNEIKTILGD